MKGYSSAQLANCTIDYVTTNAYMKWIDDYSGGLRLDGGDRNALARIVFKG